MGLVVPCVFLVFFIYLPASEDVDLSDDALLLVVLLKSVTGVGGVGCGVVFEAVCSCPLVFCLLIVFGYTLEPQETMGLSWLCKVMGWGT